MVTEHGREITGTNHVSTLTGNLPTPELQHTVPSAGLSHSVPGVDGPTGPWLRSGSTPRTGRILRDLHIQNIQERFLQVGQSSWKKVFFHSRHFRRLNFCFQVNLRHRPARSAGSEAAQGRAGHQVRGSQWFPQQVIDRVKASHRAEASEPSVCCLTIKLLLRGDCGLACGCRKRWREILKPNFSNGGILQ